MKRTGVILILILALFGLADSVYLAQHAASGTPLICNIQGLSDCNVVAQSSYSQIFGIPVADYGVFFYSILFVLAALELILFDRLLRRALQGLAFVGLLFSFYSLTTQLFFIKALCIYCIASVVANIFVFALATRIEPLRRNPTPPPQDFQMPPVA